jgi:hypothetical protein
VRKLKRENIKARAAIILPALMVLAVPYNAYASEMETEEEELAAQIEFIRAHMAQAVANKEANMIDLATAHAGHPIAEHFLMIAPEIKEHDEAMHDGLQASLDQLPNMVQTSSNDDFKQEIDRVDALLEDVMNTMIPSEMKDAKFWIKVSIVVLEDAEHEYEEAISDGKIKEMIEYQDAQGFIARADAIFKKISGIEEHEREEIEGFFADLKNAIDTVQEPATVETIIGGIVHEYREVAGLEDEMTKQPSVANIKALLEKIIEEYEESEYAEAEQLAIKAYLDNYEFLESAIEEKDPELMESTEIMLREELRQLIKDRAPIEQLEVKVEQINVNLDKILALGIGIAEEEEGDPRLQYVKNIRMLLEKAVEEYEDGEYEEAMSFAIKAYLDNYEFLENDVEEQDEELNEEVEHMLRDELQEKIRNRAPASEIKQLASEINAKLDAVEVIVPEFPLGLALVMASIVGTMVVLTRAKKLGLP